MSAAVAILALVTLQRVGELVLARYNTGRLLARGAIEMAAGHYPLVVALHAAWLIALWVCGRNQPVNLFAVGIFIVLEGLRFWVIATLGPRWTTRIIVVPGEPLISAGPYRYSSHPNYAVVAAEIAVLPLALHLPLMAVIFTILNAVVLAIRMRAEARALLVVHERPSRAVP
ncbi:isoprenylcysteine carboxylmethyltransferase family protein [Bradyrhizobium sp. CB1650]|uniref:isoprenylcysteine carboxyl methyltransferase family protein n=1 Tax=Bradyrhizobium sp. CB1650 TaxID=3039153 RepID=UPI0024356F7E|nr:isoprenylcysteine carboxylmethyltransferase family protein [Bradyrhizobium sp. CB1650]WGD50070.1 isoprenylcysteine carboxylmethyltransferase family protein [Bradyrhizobium sp. CB1650]